MKYSKLNKTWSARATTLAAALALSAGVVGIANAGPMAMEAPSVVVRYDDLNLASDAGIKALYHRIASVARQVCSDTESRDPARISHSRACQHEAIERAVRTVNNSRLAAVSASATNKG